MKKKKYKQTIRISQAIADKIQAALNWKEGDNPDTRFDKDDTYTATAIFSDGCSVDVSCCGVQYNEYEEYNNAWTQAVLFNPSGGELCSSEVEEEFLGEWVLETEDAIYITNVKIK